MFDPIIPLFENGNFSIERIDELRFPLIERFYRDAKYRSKCNRRDHVYAVMQNSTVIAAARLVPQPSGHFLLRSLCVSPFMRHQGVAKHFLRFMVVAIAPANCYCYVSPSLKNLYISLEFQCLEPDTVPAEISLAYQRYRNTGRDWLLMGFNGDNR